MLPPYAKDIVFNHLKPLCRCYSRADSIAEFPHSFKFLLHYWEEPERLGKEVWTPTQQNSSYTWAINLDHYIDCFWPVGLALALDIPDAQWQRLLVSIGNEGEDMLLDRIVATRQLGRKIGVSLCYPKPYARLLKAIDARHEKQPGLLDIFVEHWYKETGHAARPGRDKQAISYN